MSFAGSLWITGIGVTCLRTLQLQMWSFFKYTFPLQKLVSKHQRGASSK
uniref:Uncharacterized protein n=1 Tax=Anguilla anguilla TaxID=7936 RepID=A0A0E9WK62_ANGAN